VQKLTPPVPLVLLKHSIVGTREGWDLLGAIPVKWNGVCVCQVLSPLEVRRGLRGSRSLAYWDFREVLSGDLGKLKLS